MFYVFSQHLKLRFEQRGVLPASFQQRDEMLNDIVLGEGFEHVDAFVVTLGAIPEFRIEERFFQRRMNGQRLRNLLRQLVESIVSRLTLLHFVDESSYGLMVLL